MLSHTNPADDPDLELWPLRTVVAKSGLSKSEIYRREAAGTFPRRRSYRGDGARKFWTSTEVRAWQREQIAADELAGMLG